MKIRSVLSLLLLTSIILPPLLKAKDSPSDTLFYTYPARQRTISGEALPIGNGSLGGMVTGGTAKELIQLNVDTLWNGDDVSMGAYQNLGYLSINFDGVKPKSVDHYQRKLHIDTAVHEVSFESNGVKHHREAFSSAPDKALVFYFSADKPLSGTIKLKDDLSFLKGTRHAPYKGAKKFDTGKKKKVRKKGGKKGEKEVISVLGYRSRKSSKITASGHKIVLDGVLENGLEYGVRLVARCSSGNISASSDGTLQFKNVKDLEIIMVADTNYKQSLKDHWRGPAVAPIIDKRIAAALKKDFKTLKANHIADYQSFYNRVKIDLGTTPANIAQLPTDERLALFQKKFKKIKKSPEVSPDVDLQELIVNYGRYLLISSSRPGTLPANLQGIWNWSNGPPWESDYHSNINIQMNYWLAEPNALGDCHTAFLDFIMAMRESYLTTTEPRLKKHPNGKPVSRGWSLRTGTNIYGADTFKWNHPGAAWYAQHLWEHYAFNENLDYLKKVYPVFKEITQFWEDRLTKRSDGTLVVPDGWSPEHGPTEPGVSYDQQIVYDIFSNYIEASAILGVDADYRKKVIDMRNHLLKPKIGKWGQLQEWETDRDRKNDHHRHTNHLFALHPGRMISPVTTPKLAAAAKVSLTARGDGGTGWSKAWKINFWARLHDGEHAHKILCEQIVHNFYKNLFDFHPPFQIDGNFGNTSGVTEMLLQSHMRAKPKAGEVVGPWIVHLLPTLPMAWNVGSVRGFRARGNLTVDMIWANGKLKKAAIHGKAGKRVPIFYNGKRSSKIIPASGTLIFTP